MDGSIAKLGVQAAPKVLYIVPVGGNPTGEWVCHTRAIISTRTCPSVGLMDMVPVQNESVPNDQSSVFWRGDSPAPPRSTAAMRITWCAGTVTSEERKRQIYAVAQEYNLLIIEDDPYYLLQYRDGVHGRLSHAPGALHAVNSQINSQQSKAADHSQHRS